MRIDDNGVGFDPATVVRGHGLNNIQERAACLGGHIDVSPREPTGTSQILSIPVEKNEHE